MSAYEPASGGQDWQRLVWVDFQAFRLLVAITVAVGMTSIVPLAVNNLGVTPSFSFTG